MTIFETAAVAEVFSNYPATIRKKLLRFRKIIFEVAANTKGVGKIQETLKWGGTGLRYRTIRQRQHDSNRSM